MTDHRHDPWARLRRLRRARRRPQAVLALLLLAFATSQVVAVPASASPGPSRPRPGSLDRTFGDDGKATTDFGNGVLSTAEALVVQRDGKLVAAGRAGSPSQGFDFALARYRRDGRLDSRFGTGGLVTTDVAGGDDFGQALALQPDGKLVVAGYSFAPGAIDPDISLTRYNADGSLDTSFGAGGRVTTPVLGLDYAYELVVQADGKLVVGGTSIFLSPSGELIQDFVLARYSADGSLDTSFGTDGTAVTSIGAYDSLGGLALQADGKLVAAGNTDGPGPVQGLSVVRYLPNGSLDPSFGGDGIVNPEVAGIGGALALIVQADGKLVTGADSVGPDGPSGFGLVRLHPDGSLDTGFGTGGAVSTSFPDHPSAIVYDLVEHPDGRLTAAGTASAASGSTSQMALASYRPDGTLDRRFGRAGRALTTFVGDLNQASALVVQHDGKLVAAGTTSRADGTLSHFALARYHGRRPHR